MWATGTRSDVMKRIAVPPIGGILTSFLLELVVCPPIYQVWRWNSEAQRTTEDWRLPRLKPAKGLAGRCRPSFTDLELLIVLGLGTLGPNVLLDHLIRHVPA